MGNERGRRATPVRTLTDPWPSARHPRAEAHAILHGRYTVRVLEPSPPAITSPPHHADDPVARAADNERLVVSPIASGDRTWAEVVAERDDPELHRWARERWLANWPALEPRSPGWAHAVEEHAALAAFVLGVWRGARTRGADRGLRATFRGFGTPFCHDDRQLRLQDGVLIHQQRGDVAGLRPDSLDEAAAFAGVPPPPAGADRVLTMEPVVTRAVADRLMAATLVLERVRWRLGLRSRVVLAADVFRLTLSTASGAVELHLDVPGYHLDGVPVLHDDDLVGRDDHVEHAEARLLAALGVEGADGVARRAAAGSAGLSPDRPGWS